MSGPKFKYSLYGFDENGTKLCYYMSVSDVAAQKESHIKITNDAFKSILASHITTVPEQRGLLGAINGKIVSYFHDTEASTCSSHATYIPNVVNLNAKIHECAKDGIKLVGVIHSHPKNEHTLSSSDMAYICKVFDTY